MESDGCSFKGETECPHGGFEGGGRVVEAFAVRTKSCLSLELLVGEAADVEDSLPYLSMGRFVR